MNIRRVVSFAFTAACLTALCGASLGVALAQIQGTAPIRPIDTAPPVVGEGAAGRDPSFPGDAVVPAPIPFSPEAPIETFVDVTATPVAAKVDGEPVYVGQVDRQLKAVFKNRAISADFLPKAEAEVLSQLVKRRLVEKYLQNDAQVVTASELDKAVATAKRQYGDDSERWEKHLKELGLTENGVRQRMAAELGWPIYLNRVITDDRLREYFDSHREEFDAYEVHGKQILIKVAQPATETEIKAAVELAKELVARINTSKVSFDDAAKQFSSAPSGGSGGDLGWIKRHGALPEPVAAELFQLKPLQASQPIVTNYGVHILWVIEGRDGPKTYAQSRANVFAAVARQVFNEVAANQLPKSKVEYTGLAPYIDADGTLVAAKSAGR